MIAATKTYKINCKFNGHENESEQITGIISLCTYILKITE